MSFEDILSQSVDVEAKIRLDHVRKHLFNAIKRDSGNILRAFSLVDTGKTSNPTADTLTDYDASCLDMIVGDISSDPGISTDFILADCSTRKHRGFPRTNSTCLFHPCQGRLCFRSIYFILFI